MCLIFVRGIHQHETGCALTVFRREDPHDETTERRPDEDNWSPDAAAVEELGELASEPPGRTR
jgi:hypothetical protein